MAMNLAAATGASQLAPANEEASGARPTPAPLTRSMPADMAFRTVVEACRREIARHRAILLATDDSEGVHQTRVALRRLRAAFVLFRDLIDDPGLSTIDAQARRLARACGPARDLHVFLTETAPDAPGIVTRMGRKLALRRLMQARRALLGEGFAAFNRGLERMADGCPSSSRETVGDFGRRKLDDCLSLVRRRGRGVSKLTAMELHRLRIAAKRLRYAATLLAPAFEPRTTAEYIKATAALQDALGTFNDRAVGKKVLTDIAETGSMRLRAPCRKLEARLVKNTPTGRHRIRKAWKSFKRAEPFWHGHEGLAAPAGRPLLCELSSAHSV